MPSFPRWRSHQGAPDAQEPLNLTPKCSPAHLPLQPRWILFNLFLTPFLLQSWFSFGHDLPLFPSLLEATLGKVDLIRFPDCLVLYRRAKNWKEFLWNGRKHETWNLVASLHLAFLFVSLKDSGTWGHLDYPPLYTGLGMCHCLINNLSLTLICSSDVACMVSHHYQLKALNRKKREAKICPLGNRQQCQVKEHSDKIPSFSSAC